MSSIQLADGEYLIWSSPRSGAKLGMMQWAVLLYVVGFHLFVGFVVVCVFTGWLGFIGGLVTFGAAVALIRWNRRRVVFFMTNQHLIDTRWLWGKKIPLASIQGCERLIAEIRTRYGVERVTTDKLLLLSAGQSMKFGPVLDFEGVWDLIHYGVLTNTINLSALPALDGGAAPAEKRNDLLLLASTKTDGDEYGPLFIGPTKIIRFTEKLPHLLQSILWTVAASENTPEEMEHHLQQPVRHPQSGHSNVWERDLCNAVVKGNTLELTTPERVIEMELRPADVTRTAAFVRAWRPAHPMR